MNDPDSSNTGGHLSRQPAPEHWCSVTYYELNKKVGETFKVPSSTPIVTVDGSAHPSGGNRLCLGAFSNVHSTEFREQIRLQIGKGVQLEVRGEGDLWLRYLLDHPVLVQSYFLEKDPNHAPVHALYQIYSSAYLKVFDLQQYYTALQKKKSAMATRGGVTTAPGVENYWRWCFVRLSFANRWSIYKNKLSFQESPCWMEVHLHRAQQLLDEVLPKITYQPRAPKYRLKRIF